MTPDKLTGVVVPEADVARDLGFADVHEFRRWETDMGLKAAELEARADALAEVADCLRGDARNALVERDEALAASRPARPPAGDRWAMAKVAWRAGNRSDGRPDLPWDDFWADLPLATQAFYQRIADAVLAASRPPLAPADERERLARVAYETCGRAGIELGIRMDVIPWDRAEEPDREVGRRIVDAVLAASRPAPAAEQGAVDPDAAIRVLHRANARGIPMGCRDFDDTREEIRKRYREIVGDILAASPPPVPADMDAAARSAMEAFRWWMDGVTPGPEYWGYLSKAERTAWYRAVGAVLAMLPDRWSAAMAWTTARPVEPGWYWARFRGGYVQPYKVDIYQARGEVPLAPGVEWAGPIQEPPARPDAGEGGEAT